MTTIQGARPAQPSESPRSATIRHEAGVRQVSMLINYWLVHSRLSYEQLIALADWGLGEKGILNKGSLSRLRSGSKARGTSIRELDALSAANRAIWLWQVEGQSAAWGELGEHGGWGVREEWMQSACWLPHPCDPNKPLKFADWAKVLAGYLDLPYLGPASLGTADALQATNALAPLLERVTKERGWGPMAAVKGLLEAYPVADTGRRARLRRLALGEQLLSAVELESELHALSEMIRTVRGISDLAYGPDELLAELKSAAPQGDE